MVPFSTSFWTHDHRTQVTVRGLAVLETDAVVLECHETRRPDRRALRWVSDAVQERVHVVRIPLSDVVAVAWRPRRIRVWRGGELDLVVRRLGALDGVLHHGGPRCLLRVERQDRRRARDLVRAATPRLLAAQADRALDDDLRALLGGPGIGVPGAERSDVAR